MQRLEQSMGEIKCTLLWFHTKFGGLLVKELVFIFDVQQSTFTNDMVMVNHFMLIQYSCDHLKPYLTYVMTSVHNS